MRAEPLVWIAAAIASVAVAAAVVGRGAAAPPVSASASSDAPPKHLAKKLKITILSTMLADKGVGEWGFSALVEVDGHRILFDTGRLPDTVSKNAVTLDVDLETVPDVVLSHHHGDHTGGFLALRQQVKGRAPKALARAHVAEGFFWPRRMPRRPAREGNPMIAARADYEAGGGTFSELTGPAELFPGVWLTGPVPRPHAEKNYGGGVRVQRPGAGAAWTEDDVPEDQSLVIDTKDGLVVLSGCGHAGVINTLEYAQKVVRNAHIHAAIGGFHLYQQTDEQLAWTGEHLAALGLEGLLGAHCTGLEATYRLRSLVGLGREACVVGAVGASYSLADGIDPLGLAR